MPRGDIQIIKEKLERLERIAISLFDRVGQLEDRLKDHEQNSQAHKI